MSPPYSQSAASPRSSSLRPLVSVVVPVYNRPILVLETLASIVQNSYRPIEIIAIDDGSTDETGAVLDTWANENVRADVFIRIIHKTNGGEASARNAGVSTSTGDFVAFLDSDDLFKPNMISELAQALRANHAAFAYAKSEQTVHGKLGATIGTQLTSRWNSIPDHNWHVSALLIRRDALLKTGPFRFDLPVSGDWEFAARVKARNSQGIFVPKILTEYRVPCLSG